ncbi:hypothetical protein ASC97_05765 [Rhizobium sp. Root1203]|nr:hypothetical protein ASC97_05765 [Rhizobium sp. Root1203]
MDDWSIPAISPPKPIQKLLSYITDRFEKPATLRVSQQAMIVHPVRMQHLIALLPRQSSETLHRPYLSLSRSEGLGFGQTGLFEDDPQCQNIGTRKWRGSAGKGPQLYGKNSAILFDVEGLIGWLREQFPRSTIHHVESRTGIPAASVENWLHRRSQPSVEHFMILLTTFGPSLLHACLRQRPGWVEHAARHERAREIDEQIARLQGERLQVVAG